MSLQACIFLILLIHTNNCAPNTYDISYEPSGGMLWRSTSDFSPQQSQSYGQIRLGQVMSIEFDFVYEGRTAGYPNEFFRIGADAKLGQYCTGQESKYPSMWLKYAPGAILDIQFSSGLSDCATKHYLDDYGNLNINAAHHIKISLNNTNVEITITGGGIGKISPYTQSWPRDRTPQSVLGSNVFVWWMGNKYYSADGDFYPGLGTFSNIVIKTNIFTFAPTMAPSAPSMNPTSSPSMRPTKNPTITGYLSPTRHPTTIPTQTPSHNPTVPPTANPTVEPTTNTPTSTTANPTVNPTINPTQIPTVIHSIVPTINPTIFPTANPTEIPSINPTINPTQIPTTNPSKNPTVIFTTNPTDIINTQSTLFPAAEAVMLHGHSFEMVHIVIIVASFVVVMVSCCIFWGFLILYQAKKAEEAGPKSPVFDSNKAMFQTEMATANNASSEAQIVYEDQEEEKNKRETEVEHGEVGHALETDVAVIGEQQTNGSTDAEFVCSSPRRKKYANDPQIPLSPGKAGVVSIGVAESDDETYYEDEYYEEDGDGFENNEREQDDTYYEDEYYDEDGFDVETRK